MLLEAANWTPDNAALVLNGAGALWRLDLGTRSLDAVPVTGLPGLNNDHVNSWSPGSGRFAYLAYPVG